MAKNRSSKIKLSFNLQAFIRNVIVTVSCLLGMGSGLLFFRQDLNATMRQYEEKPVGTVYLAEKSVRRLSARRLQWDRIERHAPVYNGDTLSAGPFSELKLTFSNGETLKIAENSTVRVFSGSQNSTFELLEGDIQVQSGRNQTVVEAPGAAETAGKIPAALLNPGTSAQIVSAEAYTIKLFEGSGTLDLNGEPMDLAAGQAFQLEENNIPVNLPLVMISPRNNTKILRAARGSAPVEFRWRVSELALDPQNSGGVKLVFSRDGDFSRPEQSWTGENLDSARIPLPEGTWYWKLFAARAETEVDSGRLDIVYAPESEALFPAEGSTQTVPPGKQELTFHWTAPEEAEAVLLEVAGNPQMNHPRIRQLIKKTDDGYGSYHCTGIGPGTWYWRVYPVYPGGVSEGDSLSALMDGNHGYWRMRPLHADILADERPSGVKTFTVVESGEMPFRIASVSIDSLNNAAAPDKSPQVIFPREGYTLESSRTPDIVFSWKNPNLYKARFQMARELDFSDSIIMDEKVTGSNIRGIFLEPGDYFWRVVGDGPQGSSSTLPVRLLVQPDLSAPSLTAPMNQEKVTIQTGKPVTFSWTKPNYVEYFLFNIYLEGSNKPLMEDVRLDGGTSIDVTFHPLTTGKFEWRVQGFINPTETSLGRSGLVAEGKFTIDPPPGVVQTSARWAAPRVDTVEIIPVSVAEVITLISPDKGVNINGLQALRSPPEVKWSAREPVSNAQLIISYNNENPLEDPIAQTYDASTPPVRLPPLSRPGRYYWVIQGNTLDRNGVVSNQIFWFDVQGIPQLPMPEPVWPRDETIIDIKYLTENRNVTFDWEKVEGANAYIFSLYRLGANYKQLILTEPADIQTYVFSDLLQLEAGHYYWQAEAVSRNESGTIEQRGIIAQHPFRITLEKSDDFRTEEVIGDKFVP